MSTDSEWKELTLTSGVTVLYGPFPRNLHQDVIERALELYPDPLPPKKVIKVVDGTETIDDLDDPTYKSELILARLNRAGHFGEAALEWCVKIIDPADWERQIPRITKYINEKPPDDSADLKVWYLAHYALRTDKDWEIIGKIRGWSEIDDEEVRRRAEFFRSDVAGAKGP